MMIAGLNAEEYAQQICAGNRRYLSRALSMAESSKAEHKDFTAQLLSLLMPFTGKSRRICITGTPGVGKSTFIESFGLFAIDQGYSPAILAIDPSSASNGGSILGDKVRMPVLARNPKAYIRPSPSRGALGGVGNSTRESLLICEAAGFNLILVETVGVGQSEAEAHSMTDLFLLLLLPVSGDELQGIKRGIMEMADIIFINKADKLAQEASTARMQIRSALSLMHPYSKEWTIPILTGSGLSGMGLQELWIAMDQFFCAERSVHYLQKRKEQQLEWFRKSLEINLLQKIYTMPAWQQLYAQAIENVKNANQPASAAANDLIATFLSGFSR
jgi:LAO/AO transport system kinase